MPTLKNLRHERFAQGVAKGLTRQRAYLDAGYRDPMGAYPLAKRPMVRARITELMESAAERAEICVAMVAENLIRHAGKAEDEGAAADLRSARTAWVAAARLTGLAAGRRRGAEATVHGVITDCPQPNEGG